MKKNIDWDLFKSGKNAQLFIEVKFFGKIPSTDSDTLVTKHYFIRDVMTTEAINSLGLKNALSFTLENIKHKILETIGD